MRSTLFETLASHLFFQMGLDKQQQGREVISCGGGGDEWMNRPGQVLQKSICRTTEFWGKGEWADCWGGNGESFDLLTC